MELLWTITIGNILTTVIIIIVILLSDLWAVAKHGSRLDLLESNVLHIREDIGNLDTALKMTDATAAAMAIRELKRSERRP